MGAALGKDGALPYSPKQPALPVPPGNEGARSAEATSQGGKGGTVRCGRVVKTRRGVYAGVAGRRRRPASASKMARVLYEDASAGLEESAFGYGDVEGRENAVEADDECDKAGLAAGELEGQEEMGADSSSQLDEELAGAQALAQHYRLQAEALALQLASARCGNCGQPTRHPVLNRNLSKS
jgi:hypothetical protein